MGRRLIFRGILLSVLIGLAPTTLWSEAKAAGTTGGANPNEKAEHRLHPYG